MNIKERSNYRYFIYLIAFVFTLLLFHPSIAKADGPIVSDDFNSCSLDAGLWSFEDPFNDASVNVTGTHAEISVPAGTAHDPYPFNEAAWLKQGVTDTDFELEVKFDSGISAQYQEQGIIIEGEDADHFLRFDFYSDGTNTHIFAATLNGGSGNPEVNNTIAGVNVAPLWLRVKREGDLWTQSYSFDGNSWTPSISFTHAITVTAVGPFAGNDGSNPAHTAEVDYFFNTASPINPEDANPITSLTVNTVGNGVATKNPDQAIYCGEDVELTAVPSAGETFNGWSGDLIGITNPITLTMNSDKVVTATFSTQNTYSLTITTVGSGTVTVDPIQADYAFGEVVTLTATPDPGQGFVGWNGDLSGNTTPVTLTVTSDHAITATFAQNTGPVIDVWYGTVQNFGQIGTPQEWVNILGNVTDSDGVASLVYTLNGGPESTLAIGPDDRRLANAGDFNIDILRTDLINGSNQVVITATDTLNNETIETVIVNYTDANTWPLPYTIDWDTVTNIQDVAQIVDGKWAIGAAGIHPLEPEYDRLIGVGDILWADYEVEVPITIHGFDLPTGSNSGGPGLGLVMRWEGHTDSPVAGWQPKSGWLPNGQIGWWRWNTSATSASLEFYTTSANESFTPALETTYMFKMRVESTPGQGGLYKLKVWEQGQTEPGNWNLSYQAGASDLGNGSFLLIAHHVDASFGNVTVTPVTGITYTLTTATEGNGTVTTDPNQSEYNDGDVITLTASADPGWFFSGWNGDLSGNISPTSLTMDSNKTVTATFTQTQATSHTLTITTVGSGTVMVDPNQTEYPFSATVTVTAVATSGWTFSGWSGDLSGNTNPVNLTMDSNKTVTATFTVQSQSAIVSDDFNSCSLNTGLWSLVDPIGDGSVNVTGTQTEISVPAGTAHDPYPVNEAVWLKQAAPDTDFELEVKFDSGISPQYQEQGIIIEGEDADHFLRFDFYSNGSNTQIFAAVLNDGSGSPQVNSTIAGVNVAPLWLRVKREGDQWTQTYSLDGSNWTESVNFTHAMTVTAVGPFAGNDGTNPAHTAVIDYFYNTAAPGPGDVNQNNLAISTVGSGSVTKNPDQATYACNDVVELTANPNAGWGFDSWSGDVVGSTNPVTLTITGSHAVTATFISSGGAGVTITQSGPLSDTVVAEGGITDTYTIVLTSAPTDTVTVNFNTDAQLDPIASINFTPLNWSEPQTITVSAVDDAIAEAFFHNSTISHSLTSADPSYNGLSVADVDVIITDNDTAGVTITKSNLDISEDGLTDSYGIVLTSKPTEPVTVTISPDGQSTASAASVTFNDTTWNITQTVTITAVDDLIVEGPHSSTITHSASSDDPNYNISVASVTASVADNDTAGVTITKSNLDISEDGLTDSYGIVLTSKPTQLVTVTISPDGQSAASAASVTFNDTTWNITQTVTITAVDDLIVEGPHSSIISHSASSADPNYDGISIASVTATVTDNDSGGGPSTGDIFLPIIMSVGSSSGGSPTPKPNLQPVQLIVEPSSNLTTATPVTLSVVIKNVGTASAAPNFWVDLYIDPLPFPNEAGHPWGMLCSPPPDPPNNPCEDEQGLAWQVTTSIGPGQVITLTSSIDDPYLSAPDTYWDGYFNKDGLKSLWVYVDSWNGLSVPEGFILESNETDNRIGPIDINVIGGGNLSGSSSTIKEPLRARPLP